MATVGVSIRALSGKGRLVGTAVDLASIVDISFRVDNVEYVIVGSRFRNSVSVLPAASRKSRRGAEYATKYPTLLLFGNGAVSFSGASSLDAVRSVVGRMASAIGFRSRKEFVINGVYVFAVVSGLRGVDLRQVCGSFNATARVESYASFKVPVGPAAITVYSSGSATIFCPFERVRDVCAFVVPALVELSVDVIEEIRGKIKDEARRYLMSTVLIARRFGLPSDVLLRHARQTFFTDAEAPAGVIARKFVLISGVAGL